MSAELSDYSECQTGTQLYAELCVELLVAQTMRQTRTSQSLALKSE